MIVRTSQEQNATNCCGCPVTQCDDPRKECISKYFEPIIQAVAEDPLPETGCATKYRKKTFTIDGTESESILVVGGVGDGEEISSVEAWQISKVHDESSGFAADSPCWTGNAVNERYCEQSGYRVEKEYEWLDDGEGGYTRILRTIDETTIGLTAYGSTPPEGVPAYTKCHFFYTLAWSYYDAGVLYESGSTTLVSDNINILGGAAIYTEYGNSYSLPVTQEDFISEAVALVDAQAIPDDPEDPCVGGACVSQSLISCFSLRAWKTKYRFGVPADFSTVEVPRSTWEMQWDEVTASSDWWAWFDGGMTGTEPTPGPVPVASKSWTWGGDMESPWSDWHEIPIPEIEGETRTVNVMVRCYNSARIGSKPTASGDQVALP